MDSPRESLKKFNLRPIKSLGQNFLINDVILDEIAGASDLGGSDLVLEIGAGTGALTARLARSAGMVAAVEVDRRFEPILKRNLKESQNVLLFIGDFLEMDLESIIKEVEAKGFYAKRLVVVANLPYYITSPLIMKLLEGKSLPAYMILMMQKEVAERLTANPGTKDYGVLTLICGYYAEVSILFNVPPEDFNPPPSVWSSVVKFDVRREPPVLVADKLRLFNVIKAAFGQRRKTLLNALGNSGIFGHISRGQLSDRIKSAGISPECRGETLSLQDFARLTKE